MNSMRLDWDAILILAVLAASVVLYFSVTRKQMGR